MTSLGISQRFWAKVEKTDECWLWTAYLNPSGYGMFRAYHDESMKLAHRFSYESAVGPIPDGKQIDHLCRVRECVRPDHLRPVTLQENIFADGSLAPAKLLRERTECSKGHELTPENVVQGRLPHHRRCRKCIREWNRTSKARAKVAA